MTSTLTPSAAIRTGAGTRPKVLQLIEATSAGVARYVADLLLRIDTNAFDVSLAYSPRRADERFWKDLEAIEGRSIRTFEIPMARSIRPLDDASALWRIFRLVTQHRIDIVHGHSAKAGFLGRLAAKLAGSRILTVYSPHAISIKANPAYASLERFAGHFTDAVLGVSRSEEEEIEGYHLLPPRKLHYVTAGIDVPAYADYVNHGEFRERMMIPKDAILIGTAGRLSPQKDPFAFVHAAALLHRQNPGLYFAWAGEGEMRADTERLAWALGVGQHMRFAGYFQDVRPFLAALDVFALTSRYESFGYVTCEAMSMGKPVVATNVAGSNELVQDGKTGFLAPVGDATACAEIWGRLAGDEVLRRRMGQAGRRRVRECYDVRRMVRQVEEFYSKLLEDSWQRQHQLIPA